MNVYQSRQRTDGRWEFTMTDGSGGRGIGYCHAAPVLSDFVKLGIEVSEEEQARWREFESKYHTDGHATRGEAEECYRRFVLDNNTVLECEDRTQQRMCKVCGAWTTKFAMVGDHKIVQLCDAHRNKEELEKLVCKPSVIFSS